MAKEIEVKTESFEPKTISFAGVERGDIVYYIAKLLAADGKSVLCIDNSKRNDLMTSIRNDYTDKETKETRLSSTYVNDIRYYGSITYTSNKKKSERAFKRFDYTVVYHGLDIDKDIWDTSDLRFVMENSDLFDRTDLSAAIKDLDMKAYPIIALYVDVFYGKIKEQDLEYTLINKEEGEELIDSISISFDPDDITARQAFQYNGIQKVSALPAPMKEFLLAVYEKVTGSKPAKEKKLIADAN